MAYGIRAADLAGSVEIEDGYPRFGHWLKYYDPDAESGRGVVEFTDLAEEALLFETHEEAWEFWLQQSTVKPLREDGKPNRPLTAVTIVIDEI